MLFRSEVYEVVFVDGIHLGRKAVVVIAQTREHVVGWYVARTENSRAWEALMSRIALTKTLNNTKTNIMASILILPAGIAQPDQKSIISHFHPQQRQGQKTASRYRKQKTRQQSRIDPNQSGFKKNPGNKK